MRPRGEVTAKLSIERARATALRHCTVGTGEKLDLLNSRFVQANADVVLSFVVLSCTAEHSERRLASESLTCTDGGFLNGPKLARGLTGMSTGLSLVEFAA